MTLAIERVQNFPPHLSCFYTTWHYTKNRKFMLSSSQ